MSRTYRRLIGNALGGRPLSIKKNKKENVVEYEEEYSIRFKNRIFYKQYNVGRSVCKSEGMNILNNERIFDANNLEWYNQRQDFFYIKCDKIPKLKRHGTKDELLYREVIDIEYDIKLLKNNSPYFDKWESFYNYPKEKPKNKFELFRDLKNLTFMELKYLYSYGVGNYCITPYGNWYENEGNVIHSDNKFYYRNLLVMDNFYGKKTMYIDVKKYNTVKKVLDYLLTQGYGVLLPSLIPKGYNNYYYLYLKLLKDGSLVSHHEHVNEKRVFDSYKNFLNVVKLLLKNHKFTTENINGFIFDDLRILEDQVYWYYKLCKSS